MLAHGYPAAASQRSTREHVAVDFRAANIDCSAQASLATPMLQIGLSIATNASLHMMMSRMASASPPKTVDKSDAARAPDVTTGRHHVATAAAIDELLAGEARANLRRARDAQREEPPKARIRIKVPPARIVAKPLQSAAWTAPFFSLAIVVGISTLISAGGIAYLFLRPQVPQSISAAELRNILDSVTQLRKQIADLSSTAASIRTANSSLPTVAHTAIQNVEREPLIQRTRATRTAGGSSAGPQAVQTPEHTGSVQASASATTTAARSMIDGWHIRRAYDGMAVLEGTPGIVEVSPGQNIPGLGRIQEIRNDGGRWQVITSKGIVVGR
jgi:hypothetical protein